MTGKKFEFPNDFIEYTDEMRKCPTILSGTLAKIEACYLNLDFYSSIQYMHCASRNNAQFGKFM